MNTKEVDTVRRRQYPGCCDITDEEGKISVRVEMPGVSREDLEIRVDGDKLIIHGRKKAAGGNGTYLLREIRDGDFLQEFTIDDTIDRNSINAVLENGVLHLTLGIKESEKPRKIEITAR